MKGSIRMNGLGAACKDDPSLDFGEKLVKWVKFALRVVLFVMNVVAIVMAVLVLEA
jgi:hypothetical protein